MAQISSDPTYPAVAEIAVTTQPVPQSEIDFFADREGVVQVFSFDTDAVYDFNWKVFQSCFGLNMIVPLLLFPWPLPAAWCCVCCYPWTFKKNIRDAANAPSPMPHFEHLPNRKV